MRKRKRKIALTFASKQTHTVRYCVASGEMFFPSIENRPFVSACLIVIFIDKFSQFCDNDYEWLSRAGASCLFAYILHVSYFEKK